MTGGSVRLSRDGAVAQVLVDNPAARNAMTAAMYDELHGHLRTVAADPDVRVLVLRGAGDAAFVSGTDIAEFRGFRTGEDGLRYNRHVEPILAELEGLPCVTVAVLRGAVMGGGLAFAVCCDLRLAADTAFFGIPVARTVGNLPAVPVLARITALLGPARTKDLVLTARTWDAERAERYGLVTEVHPAAELDAAVAALCGTLSANAPLTMSGAKEVVRRIVAATVPEGDDLISAVYSSDDFREGVEAFLDRRRPRWRNR